VTTFNTQLQDSLADTTSVKLVDVYAYMSDQVANPASYGLTNVTDTACDLTKTAIVSALLCTKDTLFPGDVSHYLFAESGGHPSPYELKLVAEEVFRNMAAVGWI
jgi:phospholipase/lecithinase/hemolysin